MPILLDLGKPVRGGDDMPLLPSQLWGYDVVKLALIEGDLYMYLRRGVQSQDSWSTMVKEINRAL